MSQTNNTNVVRIGAALAVLLVVIAAVYYFLVAKKTGVITEENVVVESSEQTITKDETPDVTQAEGVEDALGTETIILVEMSVGAEDAPITMIEYASFTCPHCANFHSDVLPLITENFIDTGKVRMIYRGVYFDQLGLWADMLARCSGPDRYFGLTSMIYEKQREWTAADSAVGVVDNLYAIGRLAGMKQEDMEACMQDNATAQALVKSSTENAEADGINSTPTFVINGQTVSNMAYSGFVDEFERILAE